MPPRPLASGYAVPAWCASTDGQRALRIGNKDCQSTATLPVQFQYRGVQHPNIKTISVAQKECVYRGVSYVRTFDAASKVVDFTARKAATDETLAA